MEKRNKIFDQQINRYNTNSAKYDTMGEKVGYDILHCAVADMDFKSPQAIINEMQKVVDHGVFGYTDLPKCYEKDVVAWMERRYNAKIDEDWVVFSPRINMAMNMIVETFTEQTDSAVVLMPAYTAFVNAVEKYGRTLIPSPLKEADGNWSVDLEELESRIDKNTKIFFLCNPHNPTGRVWSRKELKEIGEFCLRHKLLLVSDDIHADIVRKKGSFHVVWQDVPQLKEQAIILNAITKTFNIPGVILSNMIIPNEKLRNTMKKTIDREGLHNPNIFAAAIIKAAYNDCDDWLFDVNEYISENMRMIKESIDSQMTDFYTYIPEGTYLMWIKYDLKKVSEERLEKIMLEKGKISVYMGSHFGKEWEGYFRLNVATSRANVEEIIKRLILCQEVISN